MARHRASSSRSVEFSRRHVLFGGALALASGAALARQPQPSRQAIPTDEFSQWIPDRVGDWSVLGTSGVVLPPPDELRDRLYDNVVTRTYVSQGQPIVMLLLAYNNLQDGVLQVHRPEVCYPVGGFELSGTREVQIAAGGRTIPANVFTAKGPDRTEQVMYFTRLAQAFPRSWIEQRVAVARENIAGRIPDGMLMRVSVLSLDQASALPVLKGFTHDFIAVSPQHLRRLLLG